MKTLKILAIAAVVLFGINLVSCDKNDNPQLDKNALVGKWQHTWTEGYDKSPEGTETWDTAGDPNYFVIFAADGTGYFSDKNSKDPFEWNLTGTNLILSEESENVSYTIQNLDEKTFTIEIRDSEGGSEYYALDTYTKVN